MVPDFDYPGRLTRAREMLDARGGDALLLSVGADLPYFTGYEAMPLERLTMLVVTSEAVSLVVPLLEAARVAVPGDAFDVVAWEETDDPVDIVAGMVGDDSEILIGDTTWAVFLLGLQRALPRSSFSSATPLTREMRMRKEPAEIERLRAAGAAADRVVGRLGEIVFRGRSERAVAADIASMTVEEGHDHATFTIVASGPNAASPHHETGPRTIEAGDSIVLDFGGRLDGYHSDTSRTLHVGEPSVDFVETFTVLEQSQRAAREAVRPGIAAQHVDRVARQVIEDAGHGDRFIHRTGHGIGLEGHEHPYIVEGNELHLEAGMAFSVEPGIYEPGRYGMRIEDIVVVTDDGLEELNRSDRGLVLVE